jgi:hypothetical protein
MNLRNTIPVCLAAFLGFLFGALFVRQTPVKAQSGLKVYVKRDYPPVPDVVPLDIPGAQVVGFSCLKDNFVECYTAYTK